MPELSPVERQALKARAHHLDPVVLIGDAGLTPGVMREINIALTSHELIKIRVAGDDREARLEMYQAICAELQAAPVQSIGKLLVVYRPKPADEAGAAKPRKPAGPRRSKKQLGARVETRKPGTPRAAPRKPAAPRKAAPRKAMQGSGRR